MARCCIGRSRDAVEQLEIATEKKTVHNGSGDAYSTAPTHKESQAKKKKLRLVVEAEIGAANGAAIEAQLETLDTTSETAVAGDSLLLVCYVFHGGCGCFLRHSFFFGGGKPHVQAAEHTIEHMSSGV